MTTCVMNLKFFTFAGFISLIFYCSLTNAQPEINDGIVSSVHRFNFKTGIKSVIPYHNRFLCLNFDNNLFFVDPKTNRVDLSVNEYSSNFRFENLKVVDDTIVGEVPWGKYYFLDTLKKLWRTYSFKKHAYPGILIFQDDDYFISKTCSGEDGGTVYFTNKTNLNIYEAACNCAVNVVKSAGYYHVTASLSHMAGFVKILRVKDPSMLKLYNNLDIWRLDENGYPESTSRKGTEMLVDTSEVTFAGSFKYKNSLLYIIQENVFENNDFGDLSHVSVDSIKHNKLVKLYNFKNWGVSETGFQNFSYNTTIISPFGPFDNNRRPSGFIYIDDNRLNLFIFDRQTK